MFTVHPDMYVYLEELKKGGFAYHARMDHLDIITSKPHQGRMHEFVVCPSSCWSIALLKAMDSDEIIGVRFDSVAHLAVGTNVNLGTVADLLELVDSWLQEYMKSPEADLEALKMHGRARELLANHLSWPISEQMRLRITHRMQQIQGGKLH